jgi:hypothetical protein
VQDQQHHAGCWLLLLCTYRCLQQQSALFVRVPRVAGAEQWLILVIHQQGTLIQCTVTSGAFASACAAASCPHSAIAVTHKLLVLRCTIQHKHLPSRPRQHTIAGTGRQRVTAQASEQTQQQQQQQEAVHSMPGNIFALLSPPPGRRISAAW